MLFELVFKIKLITPRCAVNVYFCELVIESSGFLDVEDAFLSQKTDATNASLKSHSDAT